MLDFNSTCVLAPNKKDPDPGEGIKIDFEPHYVFDFTYPTSSPLYTRGDGGTPVGSLLEWKIPLSVSDRERNIPVTYAVVQNFPNPFNPSTTIEFRLPVRSDVTLTVTDVLGRELTTLVNGVKEAGIHSIQFDAARYGSGTYFAVMRTGTGTVVTKMILAK